MKINIKDVCAGGLLASLGLFFFVKALDYGIGTSQRMGPGYFPMVLSAITIVVGFAIILPALGRPGGLPHIAYRPLIAVLASIAGFGIGLRYLGLIPAAFVTIVLSALGDSSFRPLLTLLVAGLAAVGAWLLFVVGLDLSIPAFRRLF